MKQKNNGEYSYSYYWSGTINYTCNDGHNKILNNDKRRCVFPEYFMIDSSYCSSHYYCSDHVGTDGTGGNWHSRNVSALQCIENWQALITESTKSQYAEYAIGGPTLELWIASWNSKHGKDVEENGETVYANGNNNSNDKSGYYVGNKYEANTTNCVLSSSEGYNDTLYFPHKSNEFIVTDENGEYKKRSWGYFLASPSALDGNYWLGVSYFGRVGDDKGSGDTLTIRPIILLKRGVKLIKETKDERTYYNLSI